MVDRLIKVLTSLGVVLGKDELNLSLVEEEVSEFWVSLCEEVLVDGLGLLKTLRCLKGILFI